MKKIPEYAIIILVTTLLIAIMPTDAEAQIYEDTLRLHILANSDSEEDQSLKLIIRDKLLIKYGSLLKNTDSIVEATTLTESLLTDMERDARTWLSEMGYSYDVRASVSEEWYDTREYEDFTLPAGYYTSLRIIIGKGEGRNWWCVMYPPLCMDIATESAPSDDGVIDYTKEEITLVKSGKYNIKFKILEELSRVFMKNG